MTHTRKIYLPILAMLLIAACAKVPLHPGAVNAFDSEAYDTLISVQAAIQSAKTQVATTPALAQYKPQLDQAIAAYNTTQAAYKVYHASATPTSTPPADLQASITSLVAQVGKLLTSLGVQL